MAFREEVRAMAAGARPMSAYDQLTGIRIIGLGVGTAVLAIEVDQRFHNPANVLHGGILSGLADSAMAYAVSTILGPQDSVTNIDLTIRFVRATVRGNLRVQARVLKTGRTVIPVECEVLDDKGETVAKASSSFIRRQATDGAGWLPSTASGAPDASSS